MKYYFENKDKPTYCPFENYFNLMEQEKIKQQNDLKKIVELNDKIKELQNSINNIKQLYPFFKDWSVDDLKLLINN